MRIIFCEFRFLIFDYNINYMYYIWNYNSYKSLVFKILNFCNLIISKFFLFYLKNLVFVYNVLFDWFRELLVFNFI